MEQLRADLCIVLMRSRDQLTEKGDDRVVMQAKLIDETATVGGNEARFQRDCADTAAGNALNVCEVTFRRSTFAVGIGADHRGQKQAVLQLH